MDRGNKIEKSNKLELTKISRHKVWWLFNRGPRRAQRETYPSQTLFHSEKISHTNSRNEVEAEAGVCDSSKRFSNTPFPLLIFIPSAGEWRGAVFELPFIPGHYCGPLSDEIPRCVARGKLEAKIADKMLSIFFSFFLVKIKCLQRLTKVERKFLLRLKRIVWFWS